MGDEIEQRSVRFGRLSIGYDARVLEPRPWTALQSAWAAELVEGAELPLLELCAGAGHIGLLAAHLAGCRLVAVDVDPVACSHLRANAERAGLGSRVEIRESRLEDALGTGEQFAVVIADPPWVSSTEVGRYPQDPLLAIDGGADGLQVARACVAASTGHLEPGGSLLIQLGTAAQAEQVLAETTATGWTGGGLRAGERGVVQRLLHP